jgi:hypothetical protein
VSFGVTLLPHTATGAKVRVSILAPASRQDPGAQQRHRPGDGQQGRLPGGLHCADAMTKYVLVDHAAGAQNPHLKGVALCRGAQPLLCRSGDPVGDPGSGVLLSRWPAARMDRSNGDDWRQQERQLAANLAVNSDAYPVQQHGRSAVPLQSHAIRTQPQLCKSAVPYGCSCLVC